MSDLLSCPFCGGEAEHVRVRSGENHVRCVGEECYARPTIIGVNEATVISAWNSRAVSGEREEKRSARLLSLLLAADEELRLIRMKDTAAVYDPTLRVRIHAELTGTIL